MQKLLVNLVNDVYFDNTVVYKDSYFESQWLCVIATDIITIPTMKSYNSDFLSL